MRFKAISGLVAAAAIAAIVSGCSAMATPNPAASQAPGSAGGTIGPSSRAPSPNPTEFAPATTLPGGPWTGIEWTRTASSSPIWAPNEGESFDANGGGDTGWIVYGWSGGYVAFDTMTTVAADGTATNVTATEHSLDGLRWQAGDSITFGGVGDTKTAFDGADIAGVTEGPAGLIAYLGEVVVCGNVSREEWPLAVSPDGASWHLVVAGGASSQEIVGGGAGYIAVGTGGVSTSGNGIDWHAVNLKTAAFKGLDGVDEGTSFDGGFVISGEAYGPMSQGCGAGPTPLTPALWWSADGASWTRDPVPNPLTGSAVMGVCRLGDRTLVATESQNGDVMRIWSSTDGRSWAAMPVGNRDWCALADERQLLAVSGHDPVFFNPDNPTEIDLVGADLKVTVLPQSGDIPDWDSVGAPVVLGPAGLIAADDSGNLFFGSPVTGS